MGSGVQGSLAALSSGKRDWTFIPCIARQILNHWTTREVPPALFWCSFALLGMKWTISTYRSTSVHLPISNLSLYLMLVCFFFSAHCVLCFIKSLTLSGFSIPCLQRCCLLGLPPTSLVLFLPYILKKPFKLTLRVTESIVHRLSPDFSCLWCFLKICCRNWEPTI